MVFSRLKLQYLVLRHFSLNENLFRPQVWFCTAFINKKFSTSCLSRNFDNIFYFSDAIWQATLQWYGGGFLCKIVQASKQFSMYISSFMVVVGIFFLYEVYLLFCEPLIKSNRFPRTLYELNKKRC